MPKHIIVSAAFLLACASNCKPNADEIFDRQRDELDGDEGDEGEGEGEGGVEGEGEGVDVPSTWTCPDAFYSDGDCDCGCGALDPTCGANGCATSGCSASSCDICFDDNEPVSCVRDLEQCEECSDDVQCDSGHCGVSGPANVCVEECGVANECPSSSFCDTATGLCVPFLFPGACNEAANALIFTDACNLTFESACPEFTDCDCVAEECGKSGCSCVAFGCKTDCDPCSNDAECGAGRVCRIFTSFPDSGAVCVPACTQDSECDGYGNICNDGDCLAFTTDEFCGFIPGAPPFIARFDTCQRQVNVETCASFCDADTTTCQ